MTPNILIPLAAHNASHPELFALNQSYAEAVSRAGGNPIMVARPSDQTLRGLLSTIDGILLAGGHDVDPGAYGEEKSEHTCNVDQDRDRVEITLARIAQENNIPILGICRGLQVMNVALGGSLFQHVSAELPNSLTHDMHEGHQRDFLAHAVDIQSGSLLARVCEKERIGTNSLHHQGIKRLSDKLSASGRTKDGLIEAVELDGHRFYVGVQWHPEELFDEASVRLFEVFINAAKNK